MSDVFDDESDSTDGRDVTDGCGSNEAGSKDKTSVSGSTGPMSSNQGATPSVVSEKRRRKKAKKCQVEDSFASDPQTLFVYVGDGTQTQLGWTGIYHRFHTTDKQSGASPLLWKHEKCETTIRSIEGSWYIGNTEECFRSNKFVYDDSLPHEIGEHWETFDDVHDEWRLAAVSVSDNADKWVQSCQLYFNDIAVFERRRHEAGQLSH